MERETHVPVDLRALADLRARAQVDDATISKLRAELRSVSDEAEERETALKSARAESETLRRELKGSESRSADFERNQAELGEALRNAQVGYWEASQELADSRQQLADSRQQLADSRQQLDRSKDELQQEFEKTSNLQAQLKRVVDSRAWRLISRYRSVVKRLRPGLR